ALGGVAPEMGHFALLAGADGEGLSKRLGSLSISSLREEGILPIAVASLLGRIGTSDPVEPRQSMAEVIEGFDISRFGRATPRFDPEELRMINSRIIGALDYDQVANQLTALGVQAGAVFWEAVRAQTCLPEGELTKDTWGEWTKAIIAETGEKGRAVFMPLRLALTGQKAGPELSGVLPIMGRDRILARLRGEAA
ncbi:MAG: glutamate--tRNA ligase, partial [Alphaproteobacteria bacterium]